MQVSSKKKKKYLSHEKKKLLIIILFLIWSSGEAYVFECPPGLEFNARILVCDWPQEAMCSGTAQGLDPGKDGEDGKDGKDGDDGQQLPCSVLTFKR